jgi:MFS family permease
VLFVVRELHAPEPILPLRLFRRRTFVLASSIAFLVALSMFGAVAFMPLYLQVVKGVSATSSGLRLTPMMAGLLITSIGSGQLIARTGRYRIFPILGTAILACGLYLLSTLDVGTPMLRVSLFMLVLGLGIGAVMQVVLLAVQNDTDRSQLGVATSAVAFFRSMGGAVGVALFGSLLANRLDYFLPRLVPAESLQGLDTASLRGSPAVIRALPEAAHAAVIQSFASSIHVMFEAAVPIALTAFVLCWFLREIPLRGTKNRQATDDEEEQVFASALES